jgi:peroxiredoxin
MNIFRNTLLLFLSLIVGTAFAEEGLVQIDGDAPQYIGKEVKIYEIDDYITFQRTVIATTKVGADSIFHASFYVDETKKIVIEINNVDALMYVAPKSNYTIFFPWNELGGGMKLGGNEVQVYFQDLDSNDINYKILQFHGWMDDFMAENNVFRVLDKERYRKELDTLFKVGHDYYSKETDVFLKTYATYHLGQVEQLSLSRKLGDQKLKTFSRYFKHQKINYGNDQYMIFFNSYFDNFFVDLDYKIENRVYLASLKSSPTLMVKALQEDYRMRNKDLAELVLIKTLKDNFFTGNYAQSNILYVLDSLSNHSKFAQHQKIAKNCIEALTFLEPGYPAPELRLKNNLGENISWKTFKGKYVYLNFFETWSESAIKEMKLYPSLRDKYGGDIEFVSICVDSDTSKLEKFLKDHEEFNWKIYPIGDNRDLMKRFQVQNTPSYFLIDQEGYLVAFPALSPSPNGKYETIDKTFFYIKKALHPQETFQVGQKND